MDPTPSKPRRTSISSITSRASTRSWRVPLAKQAPRTQLSAVFAESEAPVSRSPANQSALSILEARYNAGNTNGASSSSPTSMPENRRGRQATQRQLSISGDSPTSPESISEHVVSPLEQVTMNGDAAVSPESTMPVDAQATVVEESSRKRTQSSVMTGGWFGSSGRSKSQKLQNQILPGATLSREETVVQVQKEPTILAPVPTTSSWFSRSRTSTPAPTSLPTIIVASTETTAPVVPPANIDIPPIPPSLPVAVTEEIVSASPSRASWFGSMRKQDTVVLLPNVTQSASSSSHGTPASRMSDLPMESVSEQDELISEEMIATITPATFATTKARSESVTHSRSSSQQLIFQPNTRAAVPTSWFRIPGKRDSMTPSIDTHVPSLPPSPRRGQSPAPNPLLPTLMPMDRMMPLASPSLSGLGSSSARYALVSVLGRNRERMEAAMVAAAEGNANREEAIEDWVLVVRSAQESRALITRAQAISMHQPRTAQGSAPREIIEEMILELNDSVPNGSSAAPSIAPSTAPPASVWWPFTWSQGNYPSEGVGSDAQKQTRSAPVSGASSLQEPTPISPTKSAYAAPNGEPGPGSANWFGFWPWGQDTSTDGAQYPKTEAELIKEQAMARDQVRNGSGLSSPPLSSETLKPSPDDATPRPRDRNPIADDLYDNRSSWASFFSLRAAHGAKKITMDGEGEEEVMDFSEDPDMPPGPVSSVVATLKGKTPVSKVVSGASTPATKGRSSSAGPARKEVDVTKAADSTKARSSSATPSKRSAAPKAANMVLPTFEETFYTLPRALPPYTRPTSLKKMGKLVSGVLGINPAGDARRSRMREWQREHDVHVPRDYESLRASRDVGRDFPRVGEVLGINDVGGLKDCKRVAILGVHGWFPGTIMRTLFGEPTGTSPKFASMMEDAVKEFMDIHGVTLEKITMMPLEGEGTIAARVEKLYQDFLAKKEWVDDLHEADVIFVATHSQGSVVSAHLLDKLIQDGHIRTSKNWEVVRAVVDTAVGGIGIHIPPARPPQRVCCLALCGIHLGPLLYLGTSSIVNPYITYFESAAAKELFEFQDTESEVSKRYLASLESVLEHGVKFVYVASLDDQVVPIYSGVFTAINHPRILRALYIDGDAYSSSDFLSNLLVLLLKMRNAGLDDGGLLTHLSEATAGSLSGLGHSTAYLDSGAYKLAVRFLFETSDALGEDPKFEFEPFTAKASRNDYEIPWALRGLMTDPQSQELFGKELTDLRNAFDAWQPKTSALKEVRRKLEPIRGKRSRFAQDPFSPASVSSLLSPSSFAKSEKR